MHAHEKPARWEHSRKYQHVRRDKQTWLSRMHLHLLRDITRTRWLPTADTRGPSTGLTRGWYARVRPRTQGDASSRRVKGRCARGKVQVHAARHAHAHRQMGARIGVQRSARSARAEFAFSSTISRPVSTGLSCEDLEIRPSADSQRGYSSPWPKTKTGIRMQLD